jgi:hypothetical protein
VRLAAGGALAAVMLAAGAAGAGPPAKNLVLKRTDLPAGFTTRAAGLVTIGSESGGDSAVRAQLVKAGWTGGYYASYLASSSAGANTLLEVITNASIYRAVPGARRMLSVFAAQLAKAGQGTPVRGLGQEARIYGVQTTQDNVPTQHYKVIWREGRVLGSIEIVGFRGHTTSSRAVQLAHVQDRRIRAALAG